MMNQKRSKRLLLFVMALAMLLPAISFAEDAPSRAEGALPCEYTAPEEVMPYISHFYDGDPFTTVTIKVSESVTMTLPSGAQTLFFSFYKADERYAITFFDAEGKRLNAARNITSIGYLGKKAILCTMTELLNRNHTSICSIYCYTILYIS